MTRFLSLTALALSLGACADKGDDTSTDTPSGGDDTSTSTGDAGFTISGTAIDLIAHSAAAEGLCVAAADPTPALSGGELDLLASSTIGADGAYSIENVETNSTVGLLLLVQDCAGEGTVMPTATGMSSSSYADAADGDVIADFGIYSVDATTAASFSAGLAYAGYTGDLVADGALMGFVFDASGNPVDGAVVEGSSGATAYYFNGKGFDTTGTTAAANALFLVPDAGIGQYSATADGYEFESLMVGSQPGYFVIIAFNAI